MAVGAGEELSLRIFQEYLQTLGIFSTLLVTVIILGLGQIALCSPMSDLVKQTSPVLGPEAFLYPKP